MALELNDERKKALSVAINQIERQHGKGAIMRLDGLVGENGSTPREWRASFLRRRPAREARARVLAWEPERLVIAHGECASENATAILSRALSWI
jgi:hypothetical protein